MEEYARLRATTTKRDGGNATLSGQCPAARDPLAHGDSTPQSGLAECENSKDGEHGGTENEPSRSRQAAPATAAFGADTSTEDQMANCLRRAQEWEQYEFPYMGQSSQLQLCEGDKGGEVGTAPSRTELGLTEGEH